MAVGQSDSSKHIINSRDFGPRLEEHEIARRLIPFSSNKNVLDIGCGFSELLEEIEDSVLLSVGIDVDLNLLQESKKHLKRSSLLLCDADHRLPFADDSFDVVIAMGVIPYLDHPSPFLREVRRICRQMCLISTPNLGRPSRLITAAGGKIRYEKTEHKQGWDYHLFNQALIQCGWVVRTIETRFVDFPLHQYFPQRFSQWVSYSLLKKWFPKIGSELFAVCLKK
jgi:2-polyprenyl-3-methyl-5-hydroxy-6-metoxy-1,4-benzoquinol methylase